LALAVAPLKKCTSDFPEEKVAATFVAATVQARQEKPGAGYLVPSIDVV
jgi:hypothetical protein